MKIQRWKEPNVGDTVRHFEICGAYNTQFPLDLHARSSSCYIIAIDGRAINLDSPPLLG